MRPSCQHCQRTMTSQSIGLWVCLHCWLPNGHPTSVDGEPKAVGPQPVATPTSLTNDPTQPQIMEDL